MTTVAAAPADLAERIVIGSALCATANADTLLRLVDVDQFSRPYHRQIWRAVTDLRAAGSPVDPASVLGRLDAVGGIKALPDNAYLATLYGAAPTDTDGVYHARMVAAEADRRRQLAAAERWHRAAESADPDVRAAGLAEAREALERLSGAGQSGPAEADSWAPVDLGPYLRGEVKRAEPTIGVRRSDGLRFIYPGKEHSVIGEMEAGKSWFCLASVAAELAEGRNVVYIHFEEADPSDTIERLLALGCSAEQVSKLFQFIAPGAPVTPDRMARLLDPVPSLVVLDGVNEGMALHGQGIRDEDGAAAFRKLLIKPFITAGAATLSADHVVKDEERRGRYALGSIHKGNALSGALILLENVEPFGRGQRGCSRVFVTKDRPGHLRRNGKGTKTSGKTYMGDLVVDDRQIRDPDLHLKLWAPKDDEPAETDDTLAEGMADAVYEVIAGQAEPIGSERQLFALLRQAGYRWRDRTVRDAIDDLVVAGRVVEGKGSRGSKSFSAARQDPPSESS